MEQRIVGRKNNSTLPRSTKALSLERTRESVWLEEIDRVICHRIPRLSVPSPLDDYHAASDFAWGYRENRGEEGGWRLSHVASMALKTMYRWPI